jgi:thioredoxin 1
MKICFFTGLMLLCLVATPIFAAESDNADLPTLPTPGMVTMVDLGADKCIPCKMMAPILEELEKEYEGLATIAFIDVWKNPDQAKRFGIRSIPTQIFYDRDGKEVERHVGFLDKKSILKIFAKLGVTGEAAQ